jgi:hypothetical protein
MIDLSKLILQECKYNNIYYNYSNIYFSDLNSKGQQFESLKLSAQISLFKSQLQPSEFFELYNTVSNCFNTNFSILRERLDTDSKMFLKHVLTEEYWEYMIWSFYNSKLIMVN